MSGAERWLVLAALACMLGASLYGAIHGRAHGDETRLVLREQYAPAFLAAARGDVASAQALLARGQARQVAVGRAVSVHAHLGNLGVLLLLAGLVLPLTGWGRRGRQVVAAGLIAGAVLYPLGIHLQIGALGIAIPRAIAGAGALLTLGSVAALLAGVFRRSGPIPG